jgi:hypothetical protein
VSYFKDILYFFLDEPMSLTQKTIFGIVIIGGKYLQDRSTDIKNIMRKYGDFISVSTCSLA